MPCRHRFSQRRHDHVDVRSGLMQFDFLRAKVIGLKQFVPAAKSVQPNQERQGEWIAEPSYEALSGWTIQGRPEQQPVEIEVRFEETGWHHVFVRADVAASEP